MRDELVALGGGVGIEARGLVERVVARPQQLAVDVDPEVAAAELDAQPGLGAIGAPENPPQGDFDSRIEFGGIGGLRWGGGPWLVTGSWLSAGPLSSVISSPGGRPRRDVGRLFRAAAWQS